MQCRWLKRLALASTITWVALVVLIVIAQEENQILRWNHPGRTHTLFFASAGIVLDSKAQPPLPFPALQYEAHFPFKRIRPDMTTTSYSQLAGFWVESGTTAFGGRWTFCVPHWFSLMVFGVLPTIQIVRFASSHRPQGRVGFPVIPQQSEVI